MKKIGDISWTEIFEQWRVGEATNPGWVHTATVVKGWPDWESWRMFTANQLRLPKRSWEIFELTNPAEEIPSMLVGPYSGWQSRLPKPNVHTFADLVNIPKQYQHYAANEHIQHMARNYPVDTLMTGLQRLDGRIVLIEGHHRATAVAIARHDGLSTHFSEPVRIAIAKMTTADEGLLDMALSRGSTKDPK